LARHDRQLASLYAQTLEGSATPEEIRRRQRAWLQERDRCGADTACLSRVMTKRIAELRGNLPAPPVTTAQETNTTQQRTGGHSALQTTTDAGPAAANDADGALEVHPGGRLIVPHPVFQNGSSEHRQHLALARHLRHAAIGEFHDTLVPRDNPALLAGAAMDYLDVSELRPFFCTATEMNERAPDCMRFSDATHAFGIAGGNTRNLDADTFLWWRGANEFERRRSVSGFIESGLRDRITATAPDTPIRLFFTLDAVLDDYDFETGQFPVKIGLDRVDVPGSNSVAFDAADVAQPIAVPRGKAEALRQMLESRGGGRAEIVIGGAGDLEPQPPHGGEPRWKPEIASTEYYLDLDATVTLAGVIGERGQTGTESAADAGTDTGDGASAVASGTVLRDFDLRREDGRIVLDFEGYGEPTATTVEAVSHLIASASRDLVQAVAQDPNRYNMPLLRAILREDLRDRLLGSAGYAGGSEFEVRRAKTTFEDEVAPTLVAEAPSLPIPIRLYLETTLSEFDFESERIGLRVFQEQRLRIGGSYPVSLQPLFDLVPGALPMAPDAAERLVTAADAGPAPVLRLDLDIMTTRLNGVEFQMTARPAAVALLAGEDRDVVHFQETYDAAEDPENPAEDARAFLAPEPGEVVAPSQPTTYATFDVAPGMEVKTALESLSRHFSSAEIDHSADLLRAERGWCGYEDIESASIENALGAVCFVARVEEGRVSRVALHRVSTTGQTSELLQGFRNAFGAPDDRWDRDAPAGSLGREMLAWGAELSRDRPALGRVDIDMTPREAELDVIYLTPRISVLTLRVDAAASPGPTAEPVDPESQTAPAPTPSAQAPAADARSLSVVDIRLGMPREKAMTKLRDVGRIIYRAELEPAEPHLVQDRYTLALLDNGETFALHTATQSDAPVIGLARKIPVGNDVPISAIRGAVVDSYGEPRIEEKDGGGWTTWRWEPSDNRSSADIPCVQHFIDGFGSGQPPKLVDEVKDVDAISTTFDGAAKFATSSDESFFRFFLKDRAPRVGLDMEDRLGNCRPFLNVRVMPSQTHSDQIWVHLVDPAAFSKELETQNSGAGASEFDSKF
jgi:hypothetical protein